MSEASVLDVRIRDRSRDGARSVQRNLRAMGLSAAQAERAVAGMDASIDRLERSLRASERAIRQPRDALGRFTRATGQASAGVGRLSRRLGGLGGIIAGLGVGLAARQLIEYADAWTNARNRVALFTTTAQENAAVQQQLFDLAQGTRQGLGGTVELYQRLAQANERLGLAQSELLNVTRTINRAIVISGVSAESANAAIIQLSQGLSAGALRGEELNSVLEQAPRLASALAAGLGVGIGQLRSLGAAGELTAERVIGALQSQAGIIEGEFGRLNSTIGQSFDVLGNSLTRSVGQFSDATGAAQGFAGSIIGIAEAIDRASGPLSQFFAGQSQARAQAQQASEEFFRRRNIQDLGFGAPALGGAFTPQGPPLSGQGPVPFQQPAARTLDAVFYNAEREFDQFFDRLFGLLDRAIEPTGIRGDLRGAVTAGAAGLPAGRVQGGRGPLFGDLGLVRGELLGLNVVFDDTGFTIAETRSQAERWATGLNALSGTLAEVVGQTNQYAGALLGIVQGGLSGGPLGALAAGIGSLVPILLNSAEASRQAAQAERDRIQAVLDASDQRILRNDVATARARFGAEQGALGADFIRDRQLNVLGPIGDFIGDLSALSGQGLADRLGQVFSDLGRGQLTFAGVADDAGLRLSSGLQGLIEGAGFDDLQAFRTGILEAFGGERTLPQLAQHFLDLNRAAQDLSDSFQETTRSNRLRFDAEEIRLRSQFARDFQRAGSDVFGQRQAFRDFETQRLALAASERQAAAALGQGIGGGFGGFGAGRANPTAVIAPAVVQATEFGFRSLTESVGLNQREHTVLLERLRAYVETIGLTDTQTVGLLNRFRPLDTALGLTETQSTALNSGLATLAGSVGLNQTEFNALAAGFSPLSDAVGLTQTEFETFQAGLGPLGTEIGLTETQITALKDRFTPLGEALGLNEEQYRSIVGALGLFGTELGLGKDAVTSLIDGLGPLTAGGQGGVSIWQQMIDAMTPLATQLGLTTTEFGNLYTNLGAANTAFGDFIQFLVDATTTGPSTIDLPPTDPRDPFGPLSGFVNPGYVLDQIANEDTLLGPDRFGGGPRLTEPLGDQYGGQNRFGQLTVQIDTLRETSAGFFADTRMGFESIENRGVAAFSAITSGATGYGTQADAILAQQRTSWDLLGNLGVGQIGRWDSAVVGVGASLTSVASSFNAGIDQSRTGVQALERDVRRLGNIRTSSTHTVRVEYVYNTNDPAARAAFRQMLREELPDAYIEAASDDHVPRPPSGF